LYAIRKTVLAYSFKLKEKKKYTTEDKWFRFHLHNLDMVNRVENQLKLTFYLLILNWFNSFSILFIMSRKIIMSEKNEIKLVDSVHLLFWKF